MPALGAGDLGDRRRRGGEHHRTGHALELARGDPAQPVLLVDDLALLGGAQHAGHAAARRRQHRVVRLAAAAADRAAAAVKEGEGDAALARHLDQPLLRAVERPARRHQSAVLRRVAVAEHDHLAAAAEVTPVDRIGEQLAHHRGRRVEIAHGLEQRADLEMRIDGGGAVTVAAPSPPAAHRSSASTLSRSSTPLVMLTMNGPDGAHAEPAPAVAQHAEDVEDARAVRRRRPSAPPATPRAARPGSRPRSSSARNRAARSAAGFSTHSGSPISPPTTSR